MLFSKPKKKKPLKKSKKASGYAKGKKLLKKALIEDPSVRRECRTAADAEDIYDEDDFED